jgi:glycosyltransferase involved in cell wall biosynthesis
MEGHAGSICLVSPDYGSEIAASVKERALLLLKYSCSVNLLYATYHSYPDQSPAGIPFSTLYDFLDPPYWRLPTHGSNAVLQRSEKVRHALEILHARHRFDVIEFVDWGACGFRSIQARRAGIAFSDVRFVVTLHGSSAWLRDQKRLGIADKEDLRTDYAEQYAFENADVQDSMNPSLLAHARQVGWRVRDEASIESKPLMATPVASPLVSVVVTHYNLADYLPETLASLAAQTYLNLEIVVVDDGSTCPRARQMLEEQERLYPHFRFVRTENAGAGAARNRGLALAQGRYVLFFDADNIAFPNLVATLVHGLERNPDVAAMTCYALGIGDHPDPQCRPCRFVNAFGGGPHVMACFENVYGDTTALFRTDALRAVGGYESARDTPWEDWLTYVRLVHGGYRVEVAPAFLFHYRVRQESRTSRMMGQQTDRERFTQHLLQRYFTGPTLPPGVLPMTLWQVLVRFQRLSDRHNTVRHRLADSLNDWLLRVPWFHGAIKRMVGG